MRKRKFKGSILTSKYNNFMYFAALIVISEDLAREQESNGIIISFDCILWENRLTFKKIFFSNGDYFHWFWLIFVFFNPESDKTSSNYTTALNIFCKSVWMLAFSSWVTNETWNFSAIFLGHMGIVLFMSIPFRLQPFNNDGWWLNTFCKSY